MEERSRRIVETAVELAEQGGFEAVRLRDVAAHAGVALGTLYRRFRSKEDLLVAALELETRDLERRTLQRPPRGTSALERVTVFYAGATRGLTRRPNLARALVKAVASGDPELASRVNEFNHRMERLTLLALRGAPESPIPGGDEGPTAGAPPTHDEHRLCLALGLVWFALLVGWSGGLHTQHSMVERMSQAIEMLFHGAGRELRAD